MEAGLTDHVWTVAGADWLDCQINNPGHLLKGKPFSRGDTGVYSHKISRRPKTLQERNEGFIYDDETLEKLERSISTERLFPYLQLAENNRFYAIALYEWNTRVSEALYSIIQGLEVALRNSIHEVLTDAYARPDWYEVAPLLEDQRRQIDQAKGRIQEDGRDVTPGRVVAELMFGFWTSLAGTYYAQSLWDKHLYKASTAGGFGRKLVAKRLKKIRLLRNRVAHHESIIARLNNERNLKQDTQEIFEALGWICRTTARWVAHNSSFDYHYSMRPTDPNAQPRLST